MNNTEVLFIRTKIADANFFKHWFENIGRFCFHNGYAVFIDNKDKYTIETLKLWEELQEGKVDPELPEKRKNRVAVLQLRGFKDEDALKIQHIINDALIQYDINILLLDERSKLVTLGEFFNKVEKDIGIYDKIKAEKTKITTKRRK